jgi:glycosyltransferase involved in cell wall biosynthesis
VRDAKAGIACEAEDSRGLADAVRRLHRMSEAERTQMGAAGRAYYERHFDPEVLAHQLKTRIERLLVDSMEMASCREHGARDCDK